MRKGTKKAPFRNLASMRRVSFTDRRYWDEEKWSATRCRNPPILENSEQPAGRVVGLPRWTRVEAIALALGINLVVLAVGLVVVLFLP